MGIGIGETTIGISRTGAQTYLDDLNTKAITETEDKLRKLDDIRSAFEAGWQGQAELNFMTNLQNSVEEVCGVLEELKTSITSEFNTIAQAWKEQDETMVPIR